MDNLERLLKENQDAVERFVKFRLSQTGEAEDVLQEIYLTACQKFASLKNQDAFKAWILGIARNKCCDYFRKKGKQLEIPMELPAEPPLSYGRHGIAEAVQDTLGRLTAKDQQILALYFWEELPQAEIAGRLKIPLGTVKSRLHTAKQNFKKHYPYRGFLGKGEAFMKKLPEFLPEYRLEESAKPPFSVKWEELMGWFLVPKLGERLSWAMYDIPSRRCSHRYDMKVIGRAMVHGMEGVEITAAETPCSPNGKKSPTSFIAQLTDTHCRYLAAWETTDDMKRFVTFLDGDAFLPNWGFGEDNCGNETNLVPKGVIQRRGAIVTSAQAAFLLDIVGRYTVTINGRSFDTVCVMDIETYNTGTVSEQFLDRNGRTVLWRRFNRDDWAIDRYKKRWSELLPDNERLTINGQTYVHWYDCITDHILNKT